jgi:hypothetical protein
MTLSVPTRRARRGAAVAAAIGFAGNAIFQIALAAGAPLGHAAWGGAAAQLSTPERIGSAVAVIVWMAAALIVLGRVGLWSLGKRERIFRWGTWVLVGVNGVSALANFASSSRWENLVWGPTAAVLAVLCILVARSDANTSAAPLPGGGNVSRDVAPAAGTRA